MNAAERFKRESERLAALAFLAASYDGVDDDEARRIRASMAPISKSLRDACGPPGSYRASHRDSADERARWDAEPDFMRLDSWTNEQPCDHARFSHYLSRMHLRSR